MSLISGRSSIVITCHKRITPYLAGEVQSLGFAIDQVFITGIRLTGTLNDCIKLNLNLRCASQVLFQLQQFKADHADKIYDQLVKYPWEELIPDSGYFSVTSNVNNPTINNSMYANLRVKDAIVDRLKKVKGSRPESGSELTGTVIHLFWKQDEVILFADTSGDSLARHGYRKIPGKAPMLEGLAAATIFATKWDRQNPFINPMCGAGTLAIEAALIATNRRPGLFRIRYAFMHLLGYDPARYLSEKELLLNQIIQVPGLIISATDISGKAIEIAEKNAEAAGVKELISFKVCDFAETNVPGNKSGVIMINPEYGERLGEIKELQETYGRIGDFLKKKCGGYYGYVFTGNLELAKKIGLKAKRRIEFYNSTIDCRLLEYELYSGSRRLVKEEIKS